MNALVERNSQTLMTGQWSFLIIYKCTLHIDIHRSITYHMALFHHLVGKKVKEFARLLLLVFLCLLGSAGSSTGTGGGGPRPDRRTASLRRAPSTRGRRRTRQGRKTRRRREAATKQSQLREGVRKISRNFPIFKGIITALLRAN